MPQIPAGWEETTLGKLIYSGEIQIKNFIRKPISSNERSKIQWEYPYYWAASAIDSLNSFSLEGLHLLIAEDWTVVTNKNSPMLQLVDGKFNVSNHAHILQGNDNQKTRFLYYLLSNVNVLPYITWAVQPKLSKENLLKICFLIPESLLEQQAIAAVFSSFDDKIELLRAENQTLEQMGQELFKERFGKWKVGDELPEGWRVGKITEIIRRESISYKCDKKDLDDKGKTPILDQGTTGLYGYTSRDPDFIATKDSPVIIFTNHTCNFWFIDYPFCAIQNVLPYRWINSYDEYFLYFMTKGSIKFTEYKGHRPSFVALDFVIPPVELAQEFSKIAEGILKKISWNLEQIQTLSATRDQLLPKLMSGEVRVEF